jgi:hypothetical protein
MIDGWLRQSQIGQSRSSVLNPLAWALVILVGGIAASHYSGASDWITQSLGVAALLDFLLFACAYVYFMFRNPDALRSESYSLSKMAIERGLLGDSMFGIAQSDQPSSVITSKAANDYHFKTGQRK